MATTYSAWDSRAWVPSGASVTKQYRVRLDTQLNTYDEYCTIDCWLYLEISSTVSHNNYHWGASNGAAGTVNTTYGGSKLVLCYSWNTGALSRGHSAYTAAVAGSMYASSSGGKNTWNNEVVTATAYYTIPARASYAVTYNANGGTGSETGTKWYNEALTLSNGSAFTRENYKILKWNTAADGSGTDYALGSTYAAANNAALTLYAIWQPAPTCTVTVTSSTPYYTGKASYAVNITNAAASTDLDSSATVSSIVLRLNTQTATRSNNGSLSITPDTAGDFTPVVVITDSLGASRTYELSSITVKQYVAPSVSFEVERTTDTGVTDESTGTSCVIEATFTFCEDAYPLAAPAVTSNTSSAAISWYTTRSATGAVSGAVTWANVRSGQKIYGLIKNAFLTTTSYTIGITPRDSRTSGTEKIQTLPAAIYPIDVYAEGGGVAFGRIASDDDLWSNMDAYFEKDIILVLDDTAASGTDYEIIEALKALGWIDSNGNWT